MTTRRDYTNLADAVIVYLSHCIHKFYVNLVFIHGSISPTYALLYSHGARLLPFFTCYARRKGFSEELPYKWVVDLEDGRLTTCVHFV